MDIYDICEETEVKAHVANRATTSFTLVGSSLRLYPVNPSSTRNHAAKSKRRSGERYWFALDIC